MDLDIAGIHFTVRSKERILLEEPQPAYRPFIKKPGSGAFTIPVSLEMHDFPRTETLPRVFESGESWSAFRDGDAYVMSLVSPEWDEPVWSMRFNPAFDHVHVCLGKALVADVNGTPRVSDLFTYPLGQLLLMYVLAHKEGALVHAAGVVFKEKAYIFPGRSGAGKSTISNLFQSRGYEVLSDDRVAIRKIGGGYKAFGTPWSGQADIALNSEVTLGGIFFIRQGSKNEIITLTPGAAAERLFPVTSIPWYDEETMSRILLFCEDLLVHLPSYELYFRPDERVVDIIDEFLSAP